MLIGHHTEKLAIKDLLVLLVDIDRYQAFLAILKVHPCLSADTLAYLHRLLSARRPRSLRTVSLLRKPDRAEVPVEVDWIGFDIPDVWVVGYGLDWAERFRTLPDICEVDPTG